VALPGGDGKLEVPSPHEEVHMSATREVKFKLLAVAASALTVSLTFAGCGGGGREAPPAPPWTGTKQLGVAGAYTEAIGVAVDASGNVYVAGNTEGGLDGNTLKGTSDYFFTKYDSSGTRLFTRQTGTAGPVIAARGVAVDAAGSVYVVGFTEGGLDGNNLTGTSDFFLTKYDSSGTRLFTRQTGTTGRSADGHCVAIDANGNMYVAGYTDGGLDGNSLTGATDFFLAKYSSSGTKLYTRQMGTAGAFTIANGVAADASGNVYVAGYTEGGLDGNTITGRSDLFLTKYDSMGTKVRTKQLGAVGARTMASGVAVDASGAVYVAGFTRGGLDGNTLSGIRDFFLTKYDSSGTKLYTRQTGSTGSETAATGVAVDASGAVYVAGYTYGGLDGNTLTGLDDFFVTKYDPSGTKVRTKQLGAVGVNTNATGVAVDSSGAVYVAGYTYGGLDGNTLTGLDDFFVTKYDPAGNRQ
jgi:Beta-propeller repeat